MNNTYPCPFNHYQLNMGKANNEVYAAIVLAMQEFQGNNAHDKEPGIIPLKPSPSDWSSRMLTMTAHP